MKQNNSIKIGVIAKHREKDIGSNLQAYSLVKFLINSDYNAELVDFYPNSYAAKKTWKRRLINIAKFLLLSSFRKRIFISQKFDTFENKYYKLSNIKCYGDRELSETLGDYDLLISSGKNILNLAFSSNSFTYYLPFNNFKKIGYCLNYGSLNIGDLDKWATLKYLPHFHDLSFGSSCDCKLADELIGLKKNCIVADPIFLLNKDEWELLICKRRVQSKKYIFIYNVDDCCFCETIINSIMNHHPDYKILLLNENNSLLKIKYKYKAFSIYSPLTFIKLIRDAAFVITDSFEGVAFSLIFGKRFFTNSNSTSDIRIKYLFELINEKKNLVQTPCTNTGDIIIDGELAFSFLEKFIQSSKNYLMKAINNFNYDR